MDRELTGREATCGCPLSHPSPPRSNPPAGVPYWNVWVVDNGTL